MKQITSDQENIYARLRVHQSQTSWNDDSCSKTQHFVCNYLDCTALRSDRLWNDNKCPKSTYFICNFPKYIGVNIYIHEPCSWSDATMYCQMATIVSAADNNNVRDTATLAGISSWSSLWIGFTDVSSESGWRWADSSVTVATQHTSWHTHVSQIICMEIKWFV